MIEAVFKLFQWRWLAVASLFMTMPVRADDAFLPPEQALKFSARMDANDAEVRYEKNVETYRGTVTIRVPITGIGAVTLLATSQGCSDKGLCYSPMTSKAVLVGSTAANATGFGIEGTPGIGWRDKQGKVRGKSGMPRLSELPGITGLPDQRNKNPALERFM